MASPLDFLKKGRLHGLNHVGITVNDFEAAVKWYSEMFDWHLMNEMTIEGEQANSLVSLYGEKDLKIRLGFMGTQSEALLELFEFQPKSEPQRTVWTRPGYSHAAISVTNVPAVKAELEARGVEFVTDVQFTNGAHWAFFLDPDGNLLEIIDYHALRLPMKFFPNLVGKILKKMQFGAYYI